MSNPDNITCKCPGGMNAKDSSIVDRLHIKLNQKVKKGELLAILSSGDYEMKLTADSDGIITELFVEESQTLYKNDMMWTIGNR